MINKYRAGLSRNESRILSDLSYRKKGIFTINDIKNYVENPRDFIYILTKKNWILRIKNGVYMIAPLEAGELGSQSYTVHSFVIASHLVEPYYISHWSALNHHGFTEQTPPAVYITTIKPRNKKKILDIKFIFVTVLEYKMFGFTDMKIENTNVKISNPEKTIVDCLDHPEHCGGIEEIARAIYFEHEQLDFRKISKIVKKMKNKTIIKRLGYLLELFEFEQYSNIFDRNELSAGYSKLDPKMPKNGNTNEKWKLFVNVKIEPKQWLI